MGKLSLYTLLETRGSLICQLQTEGLVRKEGESALNSGSLLFSSISTTLAASGLPFVAGASTVAVSSLPGSSGLQILIDWINLGHWNLPNNLSPQLKTMHGYHLKLFRRKNFPIAFYPKKGMQFPKPKCQDLQVPMARQLASQRRLNRV